MRTLAKVLAWIVVIGTMALLYRNSRSVHLREHEQVGATLENLKEQDSRLDRHLLQSRYYVERNYDPLNRALDSIERSLNFLERGDVRAYRLAQPAFNEAFEQYKKLFGKRKQLVERFKSGNAVLRNSLYNLSEAAQRAAHGLPADEVALVQAALREVLQYNVTGGVSAARAARAHFQSLQRQRASRTAAAATSTETAGSAGAPVTAAGSEEGRSVRPEVAAEVIIFGRHLDNILDRKPEVDGLVKAALQAPSVAMGDAIYKRYTESYVRAAHRANIYRLLLFALAVGLLLYIALSIIKLKLANWLLARSNQQLEQLNEAAQRFVPHEFLEHMGRRDLADVELGDHRPSTMTVFFSDIRSFTSMSENMSPSENFDFINDYLQEMGPIIREHKGFIDKYIGDAIMALFDGHADSAVKASLAMLRGLHASNERRRERGMPSIRIGIGLHTGEVMLGTVGEHGRMESTVISDAVNLASRLEDLTKHYGAPLLISKATHDALHNPDDFHIRYVDRVRVKGKQIPVDIFEIYDADDQAVRAHKRSTAERLRVGVDYLRAGDHEAALQEFDACLEVYPDDPVVLAHRKSILVVTRTTLRRFDSSDKPAD